LPEVIRITPGKRAPTVSPLEGADWVAVSVMVERKNVAQVLDRLENKGASDILVFNVVNSRWVSLYHFLGAQLTGEGLDKDDILCGFWLVERLVKKDILRLTFKRQNHACRNIIYN